MEFKEQFKKRKDFIATDFIVATKCELKGGGKWS